MDTPITSTTRAAVPPVTTIKIKKSPTADTRTCDFANVTRQQLLESSQQHILDVNKGLMFFMQIMALTAQVHDHDKISQIDWFLKDFHTGFKETGWWDNHRKINRHHLSQEDGVPDDVNLVDVLEYIVDCVMAGMARSGQVYDVNINPNVLMRAFKNTVELLKSNVEVQS